jgi:hypothetical protein
MPHERALARSLGWPADAPLPWAARLAAADGVDVGTRPWGLLTPVHWRVGTDAVHLADPRELGLDEAASRAAFDAVRPLFDSEGFTMAWGAPLRWYASHPMLATLATVSIERVVGRNVDRWLPAQRDARLVRRLQSEVQMLLHSHPLNAAREAAGAAGVHPLLARCSPRAACAAPTNWTTAWPAAAAGHAAGRDDAARLLADAIDARQRICIVADYDCDGATACAVALRGLAMLGAAPGSVGYVVPDRTVHGYGLTPAIVDLALAQRQGRPDLLVTVDNGIASHAGVAHARALGLQVLVTDHHLPALVGGQVQLPDADVIVNPNQPGCASPARRWPAWA